MGINYRFWGEQIEQAAHQQMQNACELPITVAAALMPDAHLGYGLPIGGVLATRQTIIPYAVGVDIACRVKLTVLDLPLSSLNLKKDSLEKALVQNTRFGMGASWEKPKAHPVMDENWQISDLVAGLKDLAWRQLGTSGSGNHFVEFGEFELIKPLPELSPGRYLGLVSHSGSRGPGAKVAHHFTQLAMKQCSQLPKHLRELSWLEMSGDGEEYFAAMELMGKFASANHKIIHSLLLSALGASSLLQIENHHNFAWKEQHFGEELIVHRKGATPAGKGVLGYIPGSMTAPGYLVAGTGKLESLNSCSHGAGRKMSRNQAKKSITKNQLLEELNSKGVNLISAGMDEAPQAYKDIEQVMREQSELIEIVGKFQPRIVKMAPSGEKPED